jgi:two-component system response regulator
MLDRAKRVLIAEDGEEALDFMLRRGAYADAWRPDLFILNINMPKIDGLEVLERAKAMPHLASIPVVMWTVCQQFLDIERAYELGAAAFVSKPVGDDKMQSCANAIRSFWEWVRFEDRG